MRALLASFLLLSLAIAGCAEDAAPAEQSDDEAAVNDIQVKATEDTGVIRGVVVDNAIVPIEGVLISVQGTEKTTLSNENGAFGFDGLEPGSYFLSAEKLGFQSTQSSADVEAGIDSPKPIKIQMTADPTTQPYASAFVYDAYIQCSESLLLVGYAGGCQNNFLVDYNAEDGLSKTPDFAQSEMLWDSTQPAGNWMTLLYSAPRAGETLLYNYQDVEGPSPQVVKANKTLMESNGVIDSYPLQVRIFNSGMEGTDIGRDYGDPRDGDNCIERPQLGGCTTGLGATVDQILTVYTHAFYNYLPSEGWQFSKAGDPYPGA